MFPAMWPSVREKWKLGNLWHVSSTFYLRTEEPSQDNKKPEVRIGYSSKLGWYKNGTEVANGVPILSEVHLDDGRLRVAIEDVSKTPSLRRREFAKSTKPVADDAIPVAQNQIVNVSALAAVVEASYDRAFFYRYPGGAAFGPYFFMNLAPPAGYNQWQPNIPAFRLANLAMNGPSAYLRTISSNSRVYCCAAGGSTVDDRQKIIGFEGRPDETAPLWINIAGVTVKGTTVANKPVGRVGEDRLFFQQASIDAIQNPNPQSGYQQQSGYVQKKDAQGNIYYEDIPRNDLANWGSSIATKQLWSSYVYEVEIVHSKNAQGETTATATRTLIASCVNEWELKPYTGNDPNHGGQIYAYSREYVYQNGQWQYVYTLTNVEVPPQYVPVQKIGQGTVLCAIMGTREDGIIRKTVAWDASNFNEQLPGGASLIPGGLAEINPSLWLAVSRYTVGSTGASRWMYSRDKGQSWTLIHQDYTNSGNTGTYKGQNAVRKDLQLGSKEIYDAAIAAEVVLAPKG